MDIAEMVIAMANGLVGPWWRFLFLFAAFVGVLYAGAAAWRARRLGGGGGDRVGLLPLFALLLIGALLANLAVALNSTWQSYGQGMVTYGPITYDGLPNAGRLRPAINAVLTLVSMAGGAFFLRGMLILKRAVMNGASGGDSEDLVFKGVTHLVFGAALVNIDRMIAAFLATLGLAW